MKQLVCLICVLFSFALSAQNTLKLSEDSDFKTIKDGKVTIVMTPVNPLTDDQKQTIDGWVIANAPNMSLTHDGSNMTFVVSSDYNDRNVYMKLWYQMGVSFIEVVNAGSAVKMPLDEALTKFGL